MPSGLGLHFLERPLTSPHQKVCGHGEFHTRALQSGKSANRQNKNFVLLGMCEVGEVHRAGSGPGTA